MLYCIIGEIFFIHLRKLRTYNNIIMLFKTRNVIFRVFRLII